jgi:hypothetical protein
VVCGVQGSGKSHTVSVLLENMLIPDLQEIGSLEQPLAGLVLHFGEGSRPSEAAWVGVRKGRSDGVRPPNVRVFVSKSSLNTMRAVYAPLGKDVEVTPLLFNEAELDAQAFLSMMAVGSSDVAPLYIQIVLVSYKYQSIRVVLKPDCPLPEYPARTGRNILIQEIPDAP